MFHDPYLGLFNSLRMVLPLNMEGFSVVMLMADYQASPAIILFAVYVPNVPGVKAL